MLPEFTALTLTLISAHLTLAPLRLQLSALRLNTLIQPCVLGSTLSSQSNTPPDPPTDGGSRNPTRALLTAVMTRGIINTIFQQRPKTLLTFTRGFAATLQDRRNDWWGFCRKYGRGVTFYTPARDIRNRFRERRIENRRGGEVSAGGGRKTGMKRGGRSTQAQLISMGTNKHVQNMSGLWSTRPAGRSTAFEKAFAI